MKEIQIKDVKKRFKVLTIMAIISRGQQLTEAVDELSSQVLIMNLLPYFTEEATKRSPNLRECDSFIFI